MLNWLILINYSARINILKYAAHNLGKKINVEGENHFSHV